MDMNEAVVFMFNIMFDNESIVITVKVLYTLICLVAGYGIFSLMKILLKKLKEGMI